ncbi:hypothetical protein, conserved [Eimeria maxima]|uniref:Uncharacterized protein n=1 Tax=Eimeria maxima TaxID=5804 RepID=U6MHJ4_EIMMA|nr:hypothetical protein, conserved [Eimeria maxima]CDJ61095.1 hypothetical protein, conserved [Eimeria maxima]
MAARSTGGRSHTKNASTRRSRRETFIAHVSRVADSGRSRARFTTILLICGVLAVYGATRWLNAEEVAASARAAAATRREELQESLSQYEEKIKESTLLTKELADRKAEAARKQAEVQAAALEAEKAETELMEQLTLQGKGGGDLLLLAQSMERESEALEEETRVLQGKLKVLQDTSPGSMSGLLKQAYEEQRRVALKKRSVLDKMAELALLESKWGDALKTEGGELLQQIEEASQELEGLKLKKLEIKREKLENAQLALSLESKQEAKMQLEQQVRQLKGQLQMREDEQEEKEKEVADLQAGLEELKDQLGELQNEIQLAKAKKSDLELDFARKRKAFLDALAPLESSIAAKGKDSSCLAGIRRDAGDRVTRMKEQLACKALASEAVQQHKELEEYEKRLAEDHVAPERSKMKKELSEVDRYLRSPSLSANSRKVLELRKEFLEKSIREAADKALEEARGANQHLFLALEAKYIAEQQASLEVFKYFDNRIEEEPDDPVLMGQFLRAHRQFETKRLETLLLMDRAADIAREHAYGQEIKLLFKDNQKPSSGLAAERARLEGVLSETEARLRIAQRRRARARKGLLSLPRESSSRYSTSTAKGSDADVTGAPRFILKRRLQGEITLIAYYNEKIRRTHEAIEKLEVTYPDKIAAAKKAWAAIRQEYITTEARFEAAGASEEALKAVGASQASLEQMEDYVDEDGSELKADELLKDIVDDEQVSDEELLNIPDISSPSIIELIRRFGDQPPPEDEPPAPQVGQQLREAQEQQQQPQPEQQEQQQQEQQMQEQAQQDLVVAQLVHLENHGEENERTKAHQGEQRAQQEEQPTQQEEPQTQHDAQLAQQNEQPTQQEQSVGEQQAPQGEQAMQQEEEGEEEEEEDEEEGEEEGEQEEGQQEQQLKETAGGEGQGESEEETTAETPVEAEAVKEHAVGERQAQREEQLTQQEQSVGEQQVQQDDDPTQQEQAQQGEQGVQQEEEGEEEEEEDEEEGEEEGEQEEGQQEQKETAGGEGQGESEEETTAETPVEAEAVKETKWKEDTAIAAEMEAASEEETGDEEDEGDEDGEEEGQEGSGV